MLTNIKQVSVFGAGIMGSGIAQVTAEAGFEVVVFDVYPEALQRAKQVIETSLNRFVAKGKLSADEARQVSERIRYTSDMDQATRNADYVCEAVPEVLKLKQDLFAELDARCKPGAILATNTSQFSVSNIASATKGRDRVVGTHYFNPVVLMRLVEIIRGIETSDETLAVARAFNEKLGKEVVVCNKDTAGFITTRLTLAQRAEAYRIHEEGIASFEDIDKAMRLAFNHPVGPFQLADMAGLDTGVNAMTAMAATYGDRFKPPQILAQMVNSGYLGKKAGRGFYRYDTEPAAKPADIAGGKK